MANRDYPLAPTYTNGPGKPPKKGVKRSLTAEESGIVTRSQKNKAAVQEARSKGVTDYNMKDLVRKADASRDSANVVMKNAWGSLKKKK